MRLPTMASRLASAEAATFRRVSKVCKNQMMIVAKKITVKARSRKSRAFSHSSSPTLLAEGIR